MQVGMKVGVTGTHGMGTGWCDDKRHGDRFARGWELPVMGWGGDRVVQGWGLPGMGWGQGHAKDRVT